MGGATAPLAPLNLPLLSLVNDVQNNCNLSLYYCNVFHRTIMELKLILLAIVISLYATEAARDKTLGGADYLPCEQCSIPKDQYPEEG